MVNTAKLMGELERIDHRAPAGLAAVMRNEALRVVWPLPPRAPRNDPPLPKIRSRPELRQNRSRGPVQRALTRTGGTGGLKLRRHGRHEFRPTIVSDRRGE
jgi:hypothetical protein